MICRSVLAYAYPAFNAIEENGNVTFCPIVIDAESAGVRQGGSSTYIVNADGSGSIDFGISS